MKKITRKIAESLIDSSRIVSTAVEQNQETMQIVMTLSDQKVFMLKYNLQDHEKSYYCMDVDIQTV